MQKVVRLELSGFQSFDAVMAAVVNVSMPFVVVYSHLLQIDSTVTMADADRAEDGDRRGNAPELIVLDGCDSDVEELAVSEEASGVLVLPTGEEMGIRFR